jgi:hypothetical protein
MKVVQFSRNLALDPEEIQILVEAYDSVLLKFQIPDRALLLKDQLAGTIFDVAKLGERNSEMISQQAIQKLTQLRHAQPHTKIAEQVNGPTFRYSGC